MRGAPHQSMREDVPAVEHRRLRVALADDADDQRWALEQALVHEGFEVLSFEALCGNPRPETHKRARIVIVNPIGRRVGGGGFALLAQGHPHLISIKRGTINAVNLLPGDKDELVLSRVRMAGQEALIPDLEQIETRLAGLA